MRTNASTRFIADARHRPQGTSSRAKTFQRIEDAAEYLGALFLTPQSMAFHIVRNETIVGLVKAGVVGHRAQVGYVVHKPYWGRGVATEAVQRVTATLEESGGISRIWATCALDNPGSVRVAREVRLQREGILRNWVIYPALGSRAVDNYSYVRIPRDVES